MKHFHPSDLQPIERPSFRGAFARWMRGLSLVLSMLCGTFVSAQLPTSVDIDLQSSPGGDSLRVYLTPRAHGFSQLLSSLSFTIRQDATDPQLAASVTQFYPLAFPVIPGTVLLANGYRYHTYNAIGTGQIGAAGYPAWVADQPVLVMRVKVQNTACNLEAFQIAQDAWSNANNRDYYVALNAQDLTGVIEPTPAYAGPCCFAPVITDLTGATSICSVDDLHLSVTASGIGTLTYAWTGTGSFTGANTANATVTGAASGNYHIVVSNSCGASVAADVPVTVDPATTYYRDFDGDTFGDGSGAPGTVQATCVPPGIGWVTNNTDCNDGNGEVWQSNTFYIDVDGDGFDNGTAVVCYGNTAPSQYKTSTLGPDCNDNNAAVNPGVAEIDCNNIDDNCNGTVDEGSILFTYYRDVDGDTYGNSAQSITSCDDEPPTGYVTNDTDCDDTNINLHTPLTYFEDGDGDGYGSAASTTEECSFIAPDGFIDNDTDCDDGDETVWQTGTLYIDNDGDGFTAGVVEDMCFGDMAPNGYSLTPSEVADCNDNALLYADNDGDGLGAGAPVACGVTNHNDCNDSSPSILGPGSTCNDGSDCTLTSVLDANCNCVGATYRFALWNMNTAAPSTNDIPTSNTTIGAITQGNNNGTTTLLTSGSASDFSGASGGNNAGVAARTGALNLAASGSAYFQVVLTPVAGKVYTLRGIEFGSRRTGTGPQAYVIRTSADGYATNVAAGSFPDQNWVYHTPAMSPVSSAPGTALTVRIYGYNGTGSPGSGTANWRIDDLKITGCSDCASDADNDGVCDASDCAPNDATKWRTGTFYVDVDGDGYDAGSQVICYGATVPTGFRATTSGTDCNDSNASVWRNATVFTDVDGDGYTVGSSFVLCYGATLPTGHSLTSAGTDCDDNNNAVWQSGSLFVDADGDGYDAGTQTVCYGSTAPAGFSLTTNGTDCNDNAPLVHGPTTWYADSDNDGFGNAAVSLVACTAPAGYVANNTDCNDNNNAVHPGATEICNGIDDNCAGGIDEGLATSNSTPVTACDSYTWSLNGTTYTASGVYNGTTTDCVTQVLNLTITPSSNSVTNVTACGSYTWNGTTYTASGVYNGTTTDCVTEVLNLTITPSSNSVTNVTACDSYTWNGTTYTASGVYNGTTTDCVTEVLNLTITPSSNSVTNVTACDSYTWNGTTYTASGVYNGTTTDCVTQVLNLTITPSSNSVTNVTACDSYTWNGTTYTASGVYNGTTTDCVTQVLNLTITPSSNSVTNVSACDSYTWNGTTYTASGVYNGTTTDCVTQVLNLTITPSSNSVTNVTACDSYTWNGTTYTASGVYNGTTTDCVTEVLNLTITPSSNSVTNVTACDSYTWNGTTYTASGVYNGTTTDCVTQVLNLTITPSSNSVTNVTACDSYTWNGTTYTASGVYNGTTTDCVTQVLNLTITPSSNSVTNVTACDSYTWNGTTYTASGVYNGTTTDCVTEVLNLTITPSSNSVTNVTACDSYTWNGTTYTASGVYNGTTTDCVTEVLNLTITAPLTWYADLDLDGFGDPNNTITACTQPAGYTGNSNDCDDTNAAVNPANPEVCNGIDDNCAGGIDEGLIFITYYADNDGDGFGDATNSISACASVSGYVTNNTDCNDNDVTVWQSAVLYIDADGDGYDAGTQTVCYGASIPTGFSTSTSGADCDDIDPTKWQQATVFTDLDGDGYTVGSSYVLCYGSALPAGVRLTSAGTDCNDGDALVWQSNLLYIDADGDGHDAGTQLMCYGATIPTGYSATTLGPDLCDNNPDKIVPGVCGCDDSDVPTTWYHDADGDSYGDPSSAIPGFSCGQPIGYVANGTDCNDADITRWQNGTLYVDADGDGYDAGTQTVCYGATAPAGFSFTSLGSDCDDTNNAVWQYGNLYVDADGDGYDAGTQTVCYGAIAPAGFSLTTNGTDCDDTNGTIWQNASLFVDADGDGYDAGTQVVCYGATVPTGFSLTTNGIDCDDTNGTIWQNASLFVDADGDGYDAGTQTVCYGTTVPTGFSLTTNGTDCDDTNGTIWQNASLFVDADGDGYDAGTQIVCYGATVPTGFSLTTNGTDCDDTNSAVWQNANLFVDADGDGYDAGTQTVCYGATVPTGFSLTTNGTDCDDTNGTIWQNGSLFVDADGDGYDAGTQIVCYGTIAPAGFSLTTNGADCNDNDAAVHGVGSSCDDGDPSTINDVYDGTCTCVGEPVCTGNVAQLRINLDANGGDGITWEVMDASLSVVQSGGPYVGQSNTQVVEDLCLPTLPSSCYSLFLYDSFGDGINGAGWALLDEFGRTIIRDDGIFGAVSPTQPPASAGYDNGHPFCLPLGPSAVVPAHCGKLDHLRADAVFTNEVPGVSLYQFQFSVPDAGFSRLIAVPRNWVKFSEMVTNPLSPGIAYFVRVRVDQGAGGFADDHFGPGCEVGYVPGEPCAKLMDDPTAATYSCGVTRTFGGTQKIWATPISGASSYRFKFTNAALGYNRVIAFSSYVCQLNWVSLPLQNGHTYDVQVETFANAAWSGYCGAVCQLTIAAPGAMPATNTATETNSSLTVARVAPEMQLWPNPNQGERFSVKVEGLSTTEHQVMVEIIDLTGAVVMRSQEAVTDGMINTVVTPQQTLGSGTYWFRVLAEDGPITKTFIVTR